MKRAILISLCLVLGICAVAFAGANLGIAKGAIHVRPHSSKLGCTLSPAITGCADIVLIEAGSDIDAFPVFYDLVEYQGIEYGVTWPSWAYSAGFNNCSDFVIGEITEPDSGASHAWTVCQNASVAVPSYLWLFADGPGQICLTGHPEHGSAFIVDCSLQKDVLIGWGCAGVYGGASDPASGNACDDLPQAATVPATWSQIKSLFE
jgi:hypothetical protein